MKHQEVIFSVHFITQVPVNKDQGLEHAIDIPENATCRLMPGTFKVIEKKNVLDNSFAGKE